MISRKKTAGFTLLEVLVAFVILAALGGALFRTFGISINNIDAADGWARAIEVAQNQLAVASMAQPIRPGTSSGRDGDVQWEVIIEPYMPPPEAEGALGVMNLEAGHTMKVYRLVSTVSFPGRIGGARTFSLVTTKVAMDPER